MWSFNVVDLYYSLPTQGILDAVSRAIDKFGVVRFQNSVGCSVKQFLWMLKSYLSSTVLLQNGETFRERKGVCIGSKIVPILSTHPFLAEVDEGIQARVKELETPVKRIFRYVDDYLVITEKGANGFAAVESIFVQAAVDLRFTVERMKEGCLQFLDLVLLDRDDHISWRYQQRSLKPLMPYCSNQSKIIKRGVLSQLCLRHFLGRAFMRLAQAFSLN